jgi:hypothetical protein
MIWIAGRAGYKDAQTRWNQTARNLVDFILLQWASTRPAKYPVIVVVRHSVSPFKRWGLLPTQANQLVRKRCDLKPETGT